MQRYCSDSKIQELMEESESSTSESGEGCGSLVQILSDDDFDVNVDLDKDFLIPLEVPSDAGENCSGSHNKNERERDFEDILKSKEAIISKQRNEIAVLHEKNLRLETEVREARNSYSINDQNNEIDRLQEELRVTEQEKEEWQGKFLKAKSDFQKLKNLHNAVEAMRRTSGYKELGMMMEEEEEHMNNQEECGTKSSPEKSHSHQSAPSPPLAVLNNSYSVSGNEGNCLRRRKLVDADLDTGPLVQKRGIKIDNKRIVEKHGAGSTWSLEHGIDETKPGFFCECGKKFASRTNLKAHIKSCTLGKKFTCPNCKKKFFALGTMRAHIKEKHNETCEKMFGCRDCGKTFETWKILLYHKQENQMSPSPVEQMSYGEEFAGRKCDKSKDGSGSAAT